MHAADAACASLFAACAILAVGIGCLRLVGFAAFTAERRTKETCIRKVRGARMRKPGGSLDRQISRAKGVPSFPVEDGCVGRNFGARSRLTAMSSAAHYPDKCRPRDG